MDIAVAAVLDWQSVFNSESEELSVSVGDITSANQSLLFIVGATADFSHYLFGLTAKQGQLFFKLVIESVNALKLQSIHLHSLDLYIDLIPQS